MFCAVLDMYTIRLLTIDIRRIQPPGKYHQVYTPERTITVGGHFIPFDCMHLAEWSRRETQLEGGAGTNAYHISMLRVFSRMMMYIGYYREDGAYDDPDAKRDQDQCLTCLPVSSPPSILVLGPKFDMATGCIPC